MELVRLRVRNFRCFAEELDVHFERFTALIGINDSGKSSIMDALDIFLNDGAPDGDDASKHGNPKDLAITCEFSDIPDILVLDSSAETTLASEFLLNDRGNLEIEKTYSGHLAKPKLISVAAHAVHPTANAAKDLLQLKNAALKARASELGVDLSEVDKKENPALRAAIRSHVSDLDPKMSVVPLNEENGKDIWSALAMHLPAFQLFKSDRQSTDQDPEAQDPLKMAVREAIKQKQAELDELLQFIEGRVQLLAEATLAKIREMDPNLAGELRPTFAKPKWDTLFKASFVGDEGIPINKRGSGVKRLILLNFFRAKAELQAQEQHRSKVLYGIEEPETSQHPRNQRLLLRALQELSAESQVIITTHTPMLARGIPDSGLRFIEVVDGSKRRVSSGGGDTNRLIAKSLGVLPDNSVKLFIGVEGPNDINFLLHMSRILRSVDEAVPNLEQMELDGEVIFFPLGGSTLALWTSRLEPLSRPEFHLFDRDTVPPDAPKYQETIDQLNARERCVALSTERLEAESYIHGEAIREAYRQNGLAISLPDVFDPYTYVPGFVAQVLHETDRGRGAWDALTRERQAKKISKVKAFLNTQALALMTPAHLRAVDPQEEVLSWFVQMRELVTTFDE